MKSLLTSFTFFFLGSSMMMATPFDDLQYSSIADTLILPKISDFYKITTIPIPEDVILEVGGLAFMPDGKLAASTRRGEIWMISNPEMKNGLGPRFSKFASGLHEALGLAYHNNSLYVTHRPEVLRLQDKNGDGSADHFQSIYSWPLDGNYHNYSYGPVVSPEGNLMVQLNLAWIGYGASISKWRGWALEITPEGEMTPIATGMRSPSSMGYNMQGDLFYSENQGDWVGSGFIAHVEKGDFLGNPGGLKWTDEANSPLKLKPEDVPNTGEPKHEVAKRVPELKVPAVWFPHSTMGISTSEIIPDSTNGRFGPFAGQLLVGDQGQSKVMRVALEKVNGAYQGIVFPFLEGFQSGVLRMAWAKSGALFVGQTSRGWNTTPELYGLQMVNWTGRLPFEMKDVRAEADGFRINFTSEVDAATAGDISSYAIEGFTYQYHSKYGSDVVMSEEAPIRNAKVSDDGMSVHLVVENMREGFIHEIKAMGVRSKDGFPLLNNFGYYTLNNIPKSSGLLLSRYRQSPEQQNSQRAQSKIRVVDEAKIADKVETTTFAKRVTTAPSSWDGKTDYNLTLGTEPGLKFDTELLEVRAGSKVKLTFDNNDDMLHNVLIVEKGMANDIGQEALDLGLKGHELAYVPDRDDVLFHTALLEPETSESIYFIAPSTAGEYTYVCTFPGHSFTMRGTLRVLP